jgi:hypothetical protein
MFQTQISHLSSSNLQILDNMQKSRPAGQAIWVLWKTSVLCCNFLCLRDVPLAHPLLLRLRPTQVIPHFFCKTLTGRLFLSLSTSSRLAPCSRHLRQQVQVIPSLPQKTRTNHCLCRNLATLVINFFLNWTHRFHPAFFYLPGQVLSQETWTICGLYSAGSHNDLVTHILQSYLLAVPTFNLSIFIVSRCLFQCLVWGITYIPVNHPF